MNNKKHLLLSLGIVFSVNAFSQHTGKNSEKEAEAPSTEKKTSVDSKFYAQIPIAGLAGEDGFFNKDEPYAFLELERNEIAGFDQWKSGLMFKPGKVSSDVTEPLNPPYCRIERDNESKISCFDASEPCAVYDPVAGKYVERKEPLKARRSESITSATVPKVMRPFDPLFRISKPEVVDNRLEVTFYVMIDVKSQKGTASQQSAKVKCVGSLPTSDLFKKTGEASVSDVLDLLKTTGFANSGKVYRVGKN